MRYFLSLGSNIEPEKNISAAIKLLKKDFNLQKISSVYETDPVGPCREDKQMAEAQKFWNAAAEIEVPWTRTELIERLRILETSLGRKREANKFAARPIDIDVLPQNDYTTQAFIMIPLAEIAPDEKDSEKSFAAFAEDLKQEAKNFKKVKC